ncbi:MAG: c-type cytochrome [Bacteroidota bacterium]
MKNLSLYVILLSIVFFSACGGGSTGQAEQAKAPNPPKVVDPYESWQQNHGIGPVKAFTLPTEIDQELATSGKAIYETKCTACHKPDKKFIGPAPKDILSRRTPAWIMNMILVPDKMIIEDPIAKKLLMEFNGAPMANQNLKEDEARALLEYFRTL